MDERERSVEESPSNQIGSEAAPERPAPPAFDEESIHRARPAVPLAEVPARRSWPLATVLMLLLAGVAGGAIALFVVTRYLRRPAAPTSPPAIATQATAPPTTTPDSAPAPEPVSDPARTSVAPANGQSAPTEQAQATEQTSGGAAHENEESRAKDDERAAQENSGLAEGERVAAEEAAGGGSEMGESESRRSLRGALDSWIASTNARDIDRQMQWYGQRVNAFYLARNASRRDVRAEKAQLFGRADTVDVRTGEPEIKFGVDGKTATMRFRKDYAITGGGQNRRGAVLQELRWRWTQDGWKIVSERDLRVLH